MKTGGTRRSKPSASPPGLENPATARSSRTRSTPRSASGPANATSRRSHRPTKAATTTAARRPRPQPPPEEHLQTQREVLIYAPRGSLLLRLDPRSPQPSSLRSAATTPDRAFGERSPPRKNNKTLFLFGAGSFLLSLFRFLFDVYCSSIFRNSSSVRTGTPRLWAFASFEPAASPATR